MAKSREEKVGRTMMEGISVTGEKKNSSHKYQLRKENTWKREKKNSLREGKRFKWERDQRGEDDKDRWNMGQTGKQKAIGQTPLRTGENHY